MFSGVGEYMHSNVYFEEVNLRCIDTVSWKRSNHKTSLGCGLLKQT